MPRNATVVQVFVASPSDVQPERDLLEALIDEHNQTWSKSLGIVFELLRWETHVRPSFGSDPQESTRVSAFNALTQALALYNELGNFDHANLRILSDRLWMMHGAAKSSMHGLTGFRTSIASLPRMSGDLNKARKAVASNLDLIIMEVESTANTIENIVMSIESMIGPSSSRA